EDLARSVLGIEGIALAVQPSLAVTGWTADFDHGLGVAAQEPGEPESVAAGALHTEGVDGPECPSPVEEFGVATGVRRDVELTEPTAEAVDGDGDMLVLVGVDPDDDIGPVERDAAHGCWSP